MGMPSRRTNNFPESGREFGRRLCMGMPSRRTNNFPESGRGLGDRDPYNFWHTIEHIFKTT